MIPVSLNRTARGRRPGVPSVPPGSTMSPRARPLAVFSLLALAACAETGPERASYLTLMGDDTLAVEWVEFGDGYVEAEALVRGSRTTFSTYRLERSETGEITGYTASTWEGGSATGEPMRTQTLVEGPEGMEMVTTQGGEERRSEFEAEPGSVPFVDMLHWPFEAALRHQAAHGGFEDDVDIFGGRMTFELNENPDGTWALVHPSRGPSTMQLDEAGRIQWLDGTGSTRAYDLTRHGYEELDKAALGATFADRPLGELSGRGQIDDMVAGIRFTGDYGEPLRRGRDIFGGLLAFGEWWRTGANAATQLSFDGDIVIDGVTVPAGDYSLSSIPEEDGGVLIINRRTGQGGQSYDETEDEARVRMRREMHGGEPIEAFTIEVVEDPSGEADGRIELRWDDTVYWVPFTAGG